MLETKLATSDAGSKLTIEGTMDEGADFGELATKVVGDLEVDLGQVKRINSSGLLRWTRFVIALNERGAILTLMRCRPGFVNQLNMVSHLAGRHGSVDSFYAPYHCASCDTDTDILLKVREVRPGHPPERTCQECASVLEFAEDESYFHFLTTDTKAVVRLDLPCKLATTDTTAEATLLQLRAGGAFVEAPARLCVEGDSVIMECEDAKGELLGLPARVASISAASSDRAKIQLAWDNVTDVAIERLESAVEGATGSRTPYVSVLARSLMHRETIQNDLAHGDLSVHATDALPLDSKVRLAILTEDGSEVPPQVDEVAATVISVTRSKDGRIFVGLRKAN